MASIKSQRARQLLNEPRFFREEKTSGMRRYPGSSEELWVELAGDGGVVKNLSFFGQVQDWQKVLLESMASLMMGKQLTRLEELTPRECEAFLRDRNSELAIEGLAPGAEEDVKKFFTWLRLWPLERSGGEYQFPSHKGPFRNLKLADKVRELKGFLNSEEVARLYCGLPRPELVDVEELTVYVEAPYQSDRERALFEELHLLGVEMFQEENLNFIPEA